MVGVLHKKTNHSQNQSKMIGSIVNYTLSGKDINVKILLDANKKKLVVYTTTKPEGETFLDLPSDGVLYPAI